MDNILYRYLIGISVAVAFFLYAAGYVSPVSQVYNLSLAQAHNILTRTPLPPIVFGTQVQDDIPEFTSAMPARVKITLLPPPDQDDAERSYTIDVSDPARIVWSLKPNGKPAFNFVATLKAVGDHATRIGVDVTAPREDPNGAIARRLAANTTIRNLYVTAMKEQISAVLEDRDFNLSSIYPAMMAAATANFSQLHANLRHGIEADHKRIEDNIAKAYAREAGTSP